MTTEILSLEVREDGTRVVKRNIERVGNAANDADTKVVRFQKDLKEFSKNINPINQLRRALAGVGGALALGAAFQQANAFGGAMAEVSTLVDETKFSMDELTEAAKEQSIAFGSQPVQQSQALYQIISAGAMDSADAIETLNAANKLAVGGVTDVSIAADGLTTILNGYAGAAGSAADVSDTLFVGVRAGKTTVEELASTLGRVVPLAKETGVGFDELVSATAALTKGGISTAESVTGLRAVLAAVAKPSKEASDIAKQLGIEFNIAGLQSQGLAGFLEELTEKTGGSQETLAKLFGGVEALVPVFALTGAAGESFNEILEDMANKTGETEKAFEKIASQPGFKFRQLLALLQRLVIAVGDAMATVLVPVMDLLINHFDDLALAAGTFITILAVPKIIAIVGAMASLNKIVASLRAGFIALNAVMAANPFGLLLLAIASVVSALVFFRDQIKLGSDGILTLRDFAVAAFDIIREKVEPVAQLIADGFTQSVNIAREAISKIPGGFDEVIRQAKVFINSFIAPFVNGGEVIFSVFKFAFDNVRALITGNDPIGFDVFLNNLASKVRANSSRDFIGELTGAVQDGFNSTFDAIEARALELRKLRENATTGTGSNAVKNEIAKIEPTDVVDPATVGAIQDINNQLEREAMLLREASPAARELKTELFAIQDTLAGKGILLSEEEVEAEFQGMLRLNQQLRERAAILDSIRGPQEQFTSQVNAIGSLSSSGDLSTGESATATIDAASGLDFDGTQTQLDAWVEQNRVAYEQIDQLRQQDLINDQTANQLRAKADLELSEKRLSGQRKLFGSLASLATSENKKLAAIGKAAAVTQATIDGVLGVQKALASAPPPLNFALAAAVGVAAAANVAQIVAARRLGGDLNSGQMSRVGEGSRPELFRSSTTGEQFFIPPERGRVEPLPKFTEQNQANATTGQNGTADESVNPDSGQQTNVNILFDPEAMRAVTQSQGFTNDLLEIVELNQEEIRGKLGF